MILGIQSTCMLMENKCWLDNTAFSLLDSKANDAYKNRYEKGFWFVYYLIHLDKCGVATSAQLALTYARFISICLLIFFDHHFLFVLPFAETKQKKKKTKTVSKFANYFFSSSKSESSSQREHDRNAIRSQDDSISWVESKIINNKFNSNLKICITMSTTLFAIRYAG